MNSMGLGLLLGVSTAAYFVLRPAWVGIPFPNLNNDHTVRPTFRRLAGYLLGRFLGSVALGAAAGALGRFWLEGGLDRLPLSLNILLSCFLLLLLATGYSPELPLARATDPSRLRLSTFWLGLLSSGTLVTPLGIGLLQASLLHSAWQGGLFFFNIFLGHALVALPFFLNQEWTRSNPMYRALRFTLFFCALSVLFSSLSYLLRT